MTLKEDLWLLLKPYYFVNLLVGLSFIILKRTPIACNYLFAYEEEICEFSSKEIQILFFLMIVVMIRSRKTGSITMINYLTSSFIYCKIANTFLWASVDFRYGIAYLIIFVALGMVFPEPTYKGPEHIVYFRNAQSFEEELERDKRVIWVVCFFTVWNPSCVNFAPIFSKLSADYHLDNLKFGKIDVGRFPDSAKRYRIADGSLSRQLPTVIVFRNGKEVERRPTIDTGKVIKFYFTQDNLTTALGLNNLYKECVDNPIKQKTSTTAAKTDKKTN